MELIKIQYVRMLDFDYNTKEGIKEHDPNWSWIWQKTNGLLYVINHEPDIDKKYLYVKDLSGAKEN